MTDDAAATFDAFAPYFDADYRDYDDDLEMIVALAEECGGPVLEMGCGTGRALVPLLKAGLDVVGVDISPALLEVARKKLAQDDRNGQYELVEGDLTSYSLTQRDFGFSFCTSNTLMHLATPAAQLAALKNTYQHLRHDGVLLLDLFNPDVVRLVTVNGLTELADEWQDAESGSRVLKWSTRTVDFAYQLQDTLFIYEEIAIDGQNRKTVCPFTLRFLWRNEAELMLEKAGFVVETVWGDFDASPYQADSGRLLLLASKQSRLSR